MDSDDPLARERGLRLRAEEQLRELEKEKNDLLRANTSLKELLKQVRLCACL